MNTISHGPTGSHLSSLSLSEGEKQMLRKFIVLLAVVSALGVFANTALASPAQPGSFQSGIYTVVFNHGNNPGETCSNTLYSTDGTNFYFVGYYLGFETFVSNPNGILLSCHLSLAYGPGVSSNLQLNFDGLHQVYTPSGRALFSLHA